MSDPHTIKRITEIFTPFATKKRKEVIGKNGRFAHYTSADSAIKIIRTKELWMRNAKCMNDYMEIYHGYELLRNFFQKGNKDREPFDKIINLCGENIVENALDQFNIWWANINFNTFITSLSEHYTEDDAYGRLSMWRAYGQDKAKTAMILNIPLEEREGHEENPLRLVMSPVAYLSYDELVAQFLDISENVKINLEYLKSIDKSLISNCLCFALVMAAVSLKHEGFKEEKEWRIIYLSQLLPSRFMLSDIETINGVPQNIYKIPLKKDEANKIHDVDIPSLIEKVIIGPSSYPVTLIDAFKTVLKEAGVDGAESRILSSNIPLRT